MNVFRKSFFSITTTAFCIVFSFTACKNVSYLGAYHHNKDKFSGRQERDALYLVDLKDDLMLVKDFAHLAKTRAYSKAVHSFSDSAVFDYNNLQKSLNLLAIKKQVKMPNAVSEKNHALYNTLFEVESSPQFDRNYLEHISATLAKIVEEMEVYLSKGEDDSLKDFIARNMLMFKAQQTKVNRLITKVHAFNE